MQKKSKDQNNLPQDEWKNKVLLKIADLKKLKKENENTVVIPNQIHKSMDHKNNLSIQNHKNIELQKTISKYKGTHSTKTNQINDIYKTPKQQKQKNNINIKRDLNQRLQKTQQIKKQFEQIQNKTKKSIFNQNLKTQNNKARPIQLSSDGEQDKKYIIIGKSSQIVQQSIPTQLIQCQNNQKTSNPNQKQNQIDQIILKVPQILNFENKRFQYLVIDNFSLLQLWDTRNLTQDNFFREIKNKIKTKYISAAKTINIAFFTQKLIKNEKISIQAYNYCFWVYNGSIKSLQELIFSCYQSYPNNPIIVSQNLVQLDQLYDWHTIAHLQSVFIKPLFIVQKIKNARILKHQIKNCCICKSKVVYLCLCLKFATCQKQSCFLSNQLAARHYLFCRFSQNYKIYTWKNYIAAESKRGFVGIFNRKNSCFMNTALQCLAACQLLTQYFLQRKHLRNINYGNQYGTFGQISTRYGQFLRQMWTTTKQYLKIDKFYKSICRWDNKYIQDQQQDSQQFLSQLLDWLKEDLNLNFEKPIYKAEIQNDKLNLEKKAQNSWKAHLSRNNSIIEYLMAGVLRSRIQCSQCKFQSNNFQTFLTLPLPIDKIQPKKVQTFQLKVCIIYQHFCKQNNILKIQLTSNSYILLKQKIVNQLKLYNSVLVGISLINQSSKFIKNQTQQQLNQIIKIARNSPNQIKLAFLQFYREQILQSKISIYFVIKLKNKDSQQNSRQYSTLSFQRILYFKGIQKLYPKQLFKRLLKYFYNVTYRQRIQINEQDYLNHYLQKQNVPFRIIDSHMQSIFVDSQKEIKNQTQITVFFQSDQIFNITRLTAAISYVKKNSQTQSDRKDKQQKIHIYDCFKEFQRPQVIQLDNGWNCPKCKMKRAAIKKMSIYKAPKILIMFFKRFSMSAFGQKIFSKKIETFVQLPQLLNIDPFVQVKQNPYSGRKQHPLYELFAIADHLNLKSGNFQCGHYIANIYHNRQWYIINDQQISKTNDDLANSANSRNAYMLFYRKVR